MPVLTLGEGTPDKEPIPDGAIFEAQCVSVRQITEKFVDKETGKPVDRMEFKFVIQDEGDFEGRPVWGKTSLNFTQNDNCKLRHWAEEILATEFPVDYRLDTDILQGNFCRIAVGAREYEKNGENRVANYVDDVLRSRTATATTDF